MQDGSVLKQFSRNKPCYYCGAPPPSLKEHAPIRAMFEAFDCDSITVPSCKEHNKKRNLDDRAVDVFLLKGLYYGLKKGFLTKNQLKALNVARHRLEEAPEVTLKPLVNDRLGRIDTLMSHIDGKVSLEDWMRQLTAALVWSVLGYCDPSSNWQEAVVWSPDYYSDLDTGTREIYQVGVEFIQSNRTKREIDRVGEPYLDGWSSYPRPYPADIYRFEVSLWYPEDDSRSELLFRHSFYGQFCWYVLFSTSDSVKKMIADALYKVNS